MVYLRLIFFRLAGSAANFLLLILIGRNFGPEAVGIYYAAVSIGFIFASIFNMGLSRFTLRFLSSPSLFPLHHTVKLFGLLVMIFGILLGLSSIIFNWTEPQQEIKFLAQFLGIMLGGAFGAQLIISDLLKSQGNPELGLLVESAFFPFLAIMGIFILLGLGLTSNIWAPSIIAILAALMVAATALLTPIGGRIGLGPRNLTSFSTLFRQKRPYLALFWMSGLAVTLTSRLPGSIGPILLPLEQAGIFSVSLGIVSLGGTVQQASQAFFAPRFARAHESRNKRELIRTLLYSCVLMSLLFLPVSLSVIFFPNEVLSIFGISNLSAFTGMLPIMAMGQSIRMLFGNSEIMLPMIDRGTYEILALALASAVFVYLQFAAFPQGADMRIAIGYSLMMAIRGLTCGVLITLFLRKYN